MRFIFVGILALVMEIPAFSQLNIEAQLRNRFEVRDGYLKLATQESTPTVFVSQRTRLTLNYKTDGFRLKISPQDVRLWGGDAVVSSTGVASNTNIGLFEGYAEIKLGNFGWLSAGRQPLVYDSKRLLGDRQWNQNGLSYDALLIKLTVGDWNLHLGGSWNSLNESISNNFYPAKRIKSLNFLWLNRQFNENLNLSLLHLASGVPKTDSSNTLYFRQTSGLYSEYRRDNLSLWGNFYYQYGKNQKNTNVSAFLADFDLSYKISPMVAGLGFAYLSGNHKSDNERSVDHLFDPLYGNRHKFFGNIDYFRSFAIDTKDGGLVDYYFYFVCNISSKINAQNTSHYFMLAKTNPTTPNKKNLGFENDIVIKYKFSPWGNLEGGYMFFLPTQSLKTIQGISHNKFSHFFYLQLTLTPTIFREKTSESVE